MPASAVNIAQAREAGPQRIVEKNTRPAGKLDRIITTLEEAGPARPVIGGQIHDADAAC